MQIDITAQTKINKNNKLVQQSEYYIYILLVFFFCYSITNSPTCCLKSLCDLLYIHSTFIDADKYVQSLAVVSTSYFNTPNIHTPKWPSLQNIEVGRRDKCEKTRRPRDWMLSGSVCLTLTFGLNVVEHHHGILHASSQVPICRRHLVCLSCPDKLLTNISRAPTFNLRTNSLI